MTEIDWDDVISAGDCGDVVMSLRCRESVRAHFITTSLGEFELIPLDEDTFSKWVAKSWSPSDGTLPELLSVKVDGVEKLAGNHIDLIIVDELELVPLADLADDRRNARYLADMEAKLPLDMRLPQCREVELTPGVLAFPPVCARHGSRMKCESDGVWRCQELGL